MTRHIVLWAAILLVLSWHPASGQVLPNIDISGGTNGIVSLPSSVPAVYRNVFVKYTKITAPSGGAIHFLAQGGVSDEQLIRAREVMRYYLTDVPGSQYGRDKAAIANAMAARRATLVYFDNQAAAETALEGPLGEADFFGQDLYATESVVEGSPAYLNNSVRDATFEEVFHLLHGAGLAPALPSFQAEIQAVTDAAMDQGIWIAQPEWIIEGSTSFEYIISVFDVYMGLWAHDPDGTGMSFHGEYQPLSRAELATEDPRGLALMPKFHPDHLTYDARIDASFAGVFSLTRQSSLPYTLKSQYLTHATLTGSRSSGLRGNRRANRLTGNGSDNTLRGDGGNDRLDGGGGVDTAIYAGELDDYQVTVSDGILTVTDRVPNRDGSDTLRNVEFLQFVDATIEANGDPPAEPLAAPSNLTAEAQSAQSVHLRWTDESTGETGFRVQRRQQGAFATVATVGAESEEFIDTGLSAESTYTYRVQAIGDAEPSPWSNLAQATTHGLDTSACQPGPASHCFRGGRFEVQVSWRDFEGTGGVGQVVSGAADDSGLFWFFDARNWEMLVKVLDGCALNQRFWVFAAAATDVEITLRVRDTVTGEIFTHTNPLGRAAEALTATSAFATCDA